MTLRPKTLFMLRACPKCRTGCIVNEEDTPVHPALSCLNCGYRFHLPEVRPEPKEGNKEYVQPRRRAA